MALETVQITVLSTEVSPALVDDVVVRVFDVTGTTLITQATTGAVEEGVVEFTLPGDNPPIDYQLRFYIQGGAITSPQQISVYSPASAAPGATNNFEIEADLFVRSAATDIKLCRVSGIVRGPDGSPRPGVNLEWIPKFNPLVSGDQTVLCERITTRTDASGFLSVDLYRNGIYDVSVESWDHTCREVVIPDRSSMALGPLLFPVVRTVTWSPAGPWAITVGQILVLTPVITATDFRVLEGTADADVQYASEHPLIADVRISATTISLVGVAPGTTTLQVSRRDLSVVYLPDLGITGSEIAVTVT